MVIEKTPFRRVHEEKQQDTLTVKLNSEERKVLDEAKGVIEQPKDSTALKQLAWIGAKVIQGSQTGYVLETVFKNKRKNRRTGIIDFED